MRVQRLNAQAFLEALCFALFGGLILYLTVSGKYLLYVAPRLKPYLYFMAATMGVWALAGIGRLFSLQYRIHTGHCFLLVIPILLLTLPHTPLRAADFLQSGPSSDPFGGYSGEDLQGSTGSLERSSDGAVEYTKKADIQAEAQSQTEETELLAGFPGLDRENQTILVSDDYFGMWYSEFCLNMEKYEGYAVTMTGFVLKDPDRIREDEFVPARLAMTCCAADLAPVGVTCRYEGASELEEGSWVTVEGTLFVRYEEYDGKEYADPWIRAERVTPAEEVEGYVYLY
ncbi:TIGR03943 family protein [Lachnospiraceae bacterium 54-53]